MDSAGIQMCDYNIGKIVHELDRLYQILDCTRSRIENKDGVTVFIEVPDSSHAIHFEREESLVLGQLVKDWCDREMSRVRDLLYDELTKRQDEVEMQRIKNRPSKERIDGC